MISVYFEIPVNTDKAEFELRVAEIKTLQTKLISTDNLHYKYLYQSNHAQDFVVLGMIIASMEQVTLSDLLSLQCVVTKEQIEVGQKIIVYNQFDIFINKPLAIGSFSWNEAQRRFIFDVISALWGDKLATEEVFQASYEILTAEKLELLRSKGYYISEFTI